MARSVTNFYFVCAQPRRRHLGGGAVGDLPGVARSHRRDPSHQLPAPFPVLYLLPRLWQQPRAVDGLLQRRDVRRGAPHRRGHHVCREQGYAKVGGDDFKPLRRRRAARVRDQLLPPFPPSPRKPYIAGLSMGGFGALYHGLAHPERYRAIGSFSGGIGINPRNAGEQRPYRRSGRAAAEEYDLAALAKKDVEAGVKLPPLYIACGTEDFLYEANTAFVDELKGPGRRHHLGCRGGLHPRVALLGPRGRALSRLDPARRHLRQEWASARSRRSPSAQSSEHDGAARSRRALCT